MNIKKTKKEKKTNKKSLGQIITKKEHNKKYNQTHTISLCPFDF